VIAVIVPVTLVAAVGAEVAVVVVTAAAMVEVAGVAVAEGIRSSAKRVLAF
jgi:hypothetical protein